MEINKIFNEDCFDTMMGKIDKNSVNCILTSPPYNTGRASTSERSRGNHEGKYDVHLDTMTVEEYIEWTNKLFNEFDKILAKDGVILYNVSYGSDCTVNTNSVNLIWLTIASIIQNTPFTAADRITWKKKSALPNNVSSNKLTRITEDVFVFCRDEEYKTFQCNKQVKSISRTGQKYYENVFNFIDAKNNDGSCALNKATYSTELCEKLLGIYCRKEDVIYDPFMGTGTTAVAAQRLGMNYIGSEISEGQVEFASNRLIVDSQIKLVV